MINIVLGIIAYSIPTFILAYLWHLVWFKKYYQIWDYAGDKPSPPLGLASMIIQGITLSILYSWMPMEHTSMVAAAKFIGILAIFHWSTHVIAAMAKNTRLRNMSYLRMETIFLIIQFGIFTILISSVVY